MKKRIVAIILAAVMLLGMATLTSAAGVKPTGVSILQNLTMPLGTSQRFTTTLTPANADRGYLTWRAGNPAVATVTQDGVVTAHKVGQCHITAYTPDGAYATCLVTVKYTPVTAVNILPTLTMPAGTSQRFTVSVAPSDATNKGITWSVGNPGVATIDQNGVITAHKAGQCHVIATAHNGVKAVCLVTVIGRVTMYALDGRTALVPENQVAANQKVGWYLYNDYVKAITSKTDSIMKNSGYMAAYDYILDAFLSTPDDSPQELEFYKKLQDVCRLWQNAAGAPIVVTGKWVTYDRYGDPQMNVTVQNLQPFAVTYFELDWTCLDVYGKVTTDYPYLYNGNFTGYSTDPDLDGYSRDTFVWDLSDYSRTRSAGNMRVSAVSYENGYVWTR